MKYRVHFTESASADVEAAYEWIAQRAPRAAVKWFNGLLDVVDSLEMFPSRCRVAPESDKAGELFMIRGDDVYVLHIRHGARQSMEPGEIYLPPRPT